MTTFKHIISICLIFAGFTACTDEITPDQNQGGKETQVTILATIGEPETKAILRTDDPLSYGAFKEGDKIGFYAGDGLSVENQELTLNNNKQFENSNFHWEDGAKYATNIFSYFPYGENGNTDGTSIFKSIKTPTDAAYEQIEDFLTASLPSAVNGVPMSLSFKHAFSMLIITRGNGFILGEGADSTVTVTMSKPVGGVKVVNKNELLLVDKLSGGSSQQTFTATFAKIGGKDAWYVIVPSGKFTDKGNDSITVSSITLCKTNGIKETIVPSKTITPQANYKYPLTAIVQNAEAIIEPHEICQWTDSVIDLQQPAGIYDAADFYDWMTRYNTSTSDSELSKYGNQTNGKWTFFIRKDLTMTDLKSTPSFSTISKVLTNFTDTLDGCGFTFEGLELTLGSTEQDKPCGFVDDLSGVIKNLTLNNITISGKDNVGAFAGTNTGKIINCKVTGSSYITGEANVGGLVGTLNSGSIENCSSSAFVTGKTNTNKLVGTKIGGKIVNCSSTGMTTTKP